MAVIALTLALVTIFVLNRLGDYFTNQQVADLRVRSSTVAVYVRGLASERAGARPVVGADGLVDEAVGAAMSDPLQRELIADQLGQADVLIRFGFSVDDGQGVRFVPAPNGQYRMALQAPPTAGQTRETTAVTEAYGAGSILQRYTVEITLGNPYTYRATAIANVTGLLAAITLFALGLAVVVSATLARRFTTPLRQLTDASRALAEGDLSSRVPAATLRAGSSELGELAVQFNAMAERLTESVEQSHRDRDRSR
ncbi:MAG: HAMP domain-containing protein, partial [Candidatus Limnocylindrales bacterium]